MTVSGFDPGALEALADRIASEPSLAHTQSLVVAHRSEIVFERHFHGPELDGPTDIFSITKSVVSTLVGIALDEAAALTSLDQPVRELLSDDAAGEITIRHLLTMASGRTSAAAWDIDAVMLRTGSWVEHLLRAPTIDAPGTGSATTTERLIFWRRRSSGQSGSG